MGRSCWSGAGWPPSTYPAKKRRIFSIGQPRQIIAAVSRNDGTIQSVARSVTTLPSCEASWPLIGANVPMRPWRCRRTMRSSKRRARTIARWRDLSSPGESFGSSAASEVPSLSRIDRYSTWKRGSRMGLGIRSGERRGGEEGRSRWAPYHLKKKKKKKVRVQIVTEKKKPTTVCEATHIYI